MIAVHCLSPSLATFTVQQTQPPPRECADISFGAPFLDVRSLTSYERPNFSIKSAIYTNSTNYFAHQSLNFDSPQSVQNSLTPPKHALPRCDIVQ